MDWKSSSNATDTWNSTSTTMCNQPDVPASAGCVDVPASAGCVDVPASAGCVDVPANAGCISRVCRCTS